jgi:hypothetical protein
VSVTVELLQVPGDPVVVELPSKSCTEAPFSQDTVKDGVLLLVMLSVVEVPVSVPAVISGDPGSAGVDVSIVTDRVEESTDVFPAASLCLAFTR